MSAIELPEWLEATPRPHPAKFSDAILREVELLIEHHSTTYSPHVLDPFGGVGKLHEIEGYLSDHSMVPFTMVNELEPEWAVQSVEHGLTRCGDFFELTRYGLYDWYHRVEDGSYMWWKKGGPYDFIVTSPTYGNRMADKHNARDSSKRMTYKHQLGRDLTDGSSAGMQWGESYRIFHTRAWSKVHSLLADNGFFILNVKDHVRNKQIINVAQWHVDTCLRVGFDVVERIDIHTPGMGFGQHQQTLKVDHEELIVLTKG